MILKQFLSLSQVEAKAHAEQQAGLDREAMKRQKVSLIEQRKKNQTKVGEVQQRRDNQDPAFPFSCENRAAQFLNSG